MTATRHQCPACGRVEHLDEAYCEMHVAAPSLLAALKALDEAGRKLLPGPIGGKGNLSPEWEAFRSALVDAREAIRKTKA